MIPQTFSLADHLLLAAAWTAWCVLHSVLIASGWTAAAKRLMGSAYAYYRLAYVVFSTVTLAPVLLYQRAVRSPMLFEWHAPWTAVQWILLAAAGVLLAAGAREYDQPLFFGIRQIRSRGTGVDLRAPFKTGGVLERVRHPYYSAGILAVAAYGDVTVAALIAKGILISYLVAGTVLEERKLLQEFGDAYREYRRRVPMLIPRFGRVKR